MNRLVGNVDPNRYRTMILAIGTSLVLVASLLSLLVGGQSISPVTLWTELSGTTDPQTQAILWTLRLPRTLIALAAGLALGLAGALVQGHTANPLADPGLLGVSAGAAAAVVLAQLIYGNGSQHLSVVAALIGALLTALVVLIAAEQSGPATSPLRLILIGAAISAALSAATSAMVLLDATTLDSYRFWSVGSLAGRDLAVLQAIALPLTVGVLLAAINARALNHLSLGAEVAVGLGHRIKLARTIGLCSVTCLSAAAVAAAGPLGFLGLIVTHFARRVMGTNFLWSLPAAGVFGALLLLSADIAGRIIARPAEIQAGVVLAILGAPMLIWVVRRPKGWS